MHPIDQFLDLDMVFNGNADRVLNVEQSPRFCTQDNGSLEFEIALFWAENSRRCREARKRQFLVMWGRPPGEVMQ